MNKQTNNTIDYRFLARIVVEAATPLAVHSGEKEVQTDAVVIRDVNGLPYIPGSSIAGVIRHAWKESGNDVDNLFGFQKSTKNEQDEKALKGIGSRIIFSEARILNSEGKVADGLQIVNDSLLNCYAELPVRQHVRINHRGTAADMGKFDEQVVFAGTRFCFEMEMLGHKDEKETFEQLLAILYQSTFRLGGGSRKGFGKIEVIEIKYDELEIKDSYYLEKSSDLEGCKDWYRQTLPKPENSEVKIHCYMLRPENFFLFGSGFGDDDADMTPVKEQKVSWKDGPGHLANYEYLIPATSVKGALAHRTAFHYNRIDNFFADGKTKEEIEAHTGTNNEAVRILFGCEGDENGEGKQRGNVLISDMFINNAQNKVFNHVAIDRFTEGAIDGALFAEKAAYWHSDDENDYPLTLEILIDEKNIKKAIKKHDENSEKKISYENVCNAFNAALADLCEGRLPLGGSVNRGHGIFNGKKVSNYGNVFNKR